MTHRGHYKTNRGHFKTREVLQDQHSFKVKVIDKFTSKLNIKYKKLETIAG